MKNETGRIWRDYVTVRSSNKALTEVGGSAMGSLDKSGDTAYALQRAIAPDNWIRAAEWVGRKPVIGDPMLLNALERHRKDAEKWPLSTLVGALLAHPVGIVAAALSDHAGVDLTATLWEGTRLHDGRPVQILTDTNGIGMRVVVGGRIIPAGDYPSGLSPAQLAAHLQFVPLGD